MLGNLLASQESCVTAANNEVKGLDHRERDRLSQRKVPSTDTVRSTLLSGEMTRKFNEMTKSRSLIMDRWHCKSVVFCQVLAIFLISSLPVAGAEETCARWPAVQIFRYRNCLPKTQLVFVCSGTCRSYTMMNRDNATSLQSSCMCCQASEFVKARTQITCPNADGEPGFHRATVEVLMPVRCMCRPCDFIPSVVLTPNNETS